MTSRRLGTFLATWSGGFALVHLAWALGWRGATPADVAPIHDRPVFLAYDVLAGVLMAAAAVVALRLARAASGSRPPRWWRAATLVGSVAALLRGVPALAVDVATGTWTGLGPAVDVWFTAAGLAGLLLWRSSRAAAVAVPGSTRATTVTRATTLVG